jgi:soluble lytic murein transglycosylase-like protein
MNKGVRGILAVACMLLAAPAVAGNVYRCDSADGSRAYSSTRVAGAKCVVASHYQKTATRKPWPRASVASVAASAEPPSQANLRTVEAPATTAAPRRVSGQVYSYVQGGTRHYTSARPRGRVDALRTISYSYIETCYACSSRPGVDFSRVRLNTSAYDNEIAKASREYGVDEAVVRAIIHAESAFNPKALSRVGAQGLMQLMPATARRFGVGDAFDASQNIRGGVQYLAWLLKRFDGNLTLAAAGYNAGEGAVDKYKGVPPYRETQRYVERVGQLAQRYRGSLATR